MPSMHKVAYLAFQMLSAAKNSWLHLRRPPVPFSAASSSVFSRIRILYILSADWSSRLHLRVRHRLLGAVEYHSRSNKCRWAYLHMRRFLVDVRRYVCLGSRFWLGVDGVEGVRLARGSGWMELRTPGNAIVGA